MKIFNIDSFTRGWIVGDFDPAMIKTNQMELGFKYYKKGDYEKSHAHNMSDEVTVILFGEVKMNNITFKEKDIVYIEKGEFTDFECLSERAITAVYRPDGSFVSDKVLKE